MRQKCYKCFRPQSSCICSFANKIETESKFIILMHPMERQKVKNNTGFISHFSLPNSILIEGIDFSKNNTLNKYLDDSESQVYILYPFENTRSVDYYRKQMKFKKNIFIIIDATWPCAKKMIRLTPRLKDFPSITFKDLHLSKYKIKLQPKDGFISTIESIQVLLKDLSDCKLENISQKKLISFLEPFYEINRYQVECMNDPNKPTYPARLKKYNP